MEFKWPKRSHRDTDTYFAGYEKQVHVDPTTGRKRTEYVYHGDYYIFSVDDGAYTRFRRLSALRAAAATALFVGSHLLGPAGSVRPWVGIPALLSIIPLTYFWVGVVALLGAKTPRMTIRQYSFGLERMENTLWIVLALWAVALAGELVYLVMHRLFVTPELAAAAMQLAALIVMVFQQRGQSAILEACVHKPEAEKQKG